MDSKFIGKCLRLNEFGQGIVEHENKTFVIDNLLINEEAEIIITKKTHNYYLGRVHKYIKTSELRNNVNCNHKCGGCDLIHMHYPSQIKFKNNLIKDYLNEYNVLDIIEADDNYHYRNKVIYALNYTKNNIYFGLYEENTHKIIETKNCLVNNINSSNLIIKIKDYLLKNNITSVKYVMFRFTSNNDALVGLITNKELTNEE